MTRMTIWKSPPRKTAQTGLIPQLNGRQLARRRILQPHPVSKTSGTVALPYNIGLTAPPSVPAGWTAQAAPPAFSPSDIEFVTAVERELREVLFLAHVETARLFAKGESSRAVAAILLCPEYSTADFYKPLEYDWSQLQYETDEALKTYIEGKHADRRGA